jgi:PhzF family phenazine biosynthesis protein
VVEDPATGAAAAAFGGYLRSLNLIKTPATLRLHQGEDLGRPGLLIVDVPDNADHVNVTGNAVAMPG